MVGRLKPGVTVRKAAADLDLVAHQYAGIDSRFYPKRFTVIAKRSSKEAVDGLGFSRLLYHLMAAVLLLPLIGCANVANLLAACADLAVQPSLTTVFSRVARA